MLSTTSQCLSTCIYLKILHQHICNPFCTSVHTVNHHHHHHPPSSILPPLCVSVAVTVRTLRRIPFIHSFIHDSLMHSHPYKASSQCKYRSSSGFHHHRPPPVLLSLLQQQHKQQQQHQHQQQHTSGTHTTVACSPPMPTRPTTSLTVLAYNNALLHRS